jgi:hypothetical protein
MRDALLGALEPLGHWREPLLQRHGRGMRRALSYACVICVSLGVEIHPASAHTEQNHHPLAPHESGAAIALRHEASCNRMQLIQGLSPPLTRLVAGQHIQMNVRDSPTFGLRRSLPLDGRASQQNEHFERIAFLQPVACAPCQA